MTVQVRQAATSDEDLMVRVYAEHSSALHRYVLARAGGDRHLAEDVVQETMFRFWRSADRPRDIRAWLTTVASRILIDRHRRNAVRPREVGGAELEFVPAEDQLDRALTAQVVTEALRALSPQDRTVLSEVYLRGGAVVDIARQWGIPEGTAKSRVHRARRALRSVIERQGICAPV